MDNQNKAGDINFKTGDGGSFGGNGGDLHIGPGVYKAGDATQQINYSEVIEELIKGINNSDLSQDKKDGFIRKIMDGVGSVVNIATLTKLIVSLFV